MDDVSHLLARLSVDLAMLLVAFWWVLGIGVPVLFAVMVRNVVKARRALERIADAVEARPTSGGGGVLGL